MEAIVALEQRKLDTWDDLYDALDTAATVFHDFGHPASRTADARKRAMYHARVHEEKARDALKAAKP